MRFGEAIDLLLKEKGMKRAELARRIGKSRSYVSQLIIGKVGEPSLSLAYAIADALDVSLQDLADMVYGDEDA